MKSIFIFTLLMTNIVLGELIISDFDSAENLAAQLLNSDSSGVSISNVSYSGSSAASGYFTGGLSSGLGMEEGIVLTTGDAQNVASPNLTGSMSTNLGLAGDSDLDALIPGYTTYDATVLEFDFTSTGDSAYFNYAFASEEYTEWVNSSYNDVFGFFIDGENYALIPGTDDAVSINNVNQDTNSEFFNNNDPHNDPVNSQNFDITYDGFTSTFTARLTGLTAGETYNLKIAIADAGDAVYDSAVFLEAGSFSKTAIAPAGAPEASTWFMVITALLIIYMFKKKDQTEKTMGLLRQ